MGSKFSLEALLTLTDNLTRPYKRAGNNIVGVNKLMTGSMGSLNNGINKTIGFMGKGLARGATLGFGAVSAGVVVATKEFINLDNSITNAGAKFKDLDSTAATFKDSLKELSDAARAVGADTEYSAVDAAGALDKFAMAGIKSNQAMALLRGTTNLATSAGTDLTTAVDIVTDSMGAFGQMTEDTALLQSRMNAMSDQMAKTTTTANTSLTDMFEAIGKGASTFTQAGQSMATFNSLTGILANSSKKGGEAGTLLKNTMLRLGNPSAEAAKQMKALGVVTSDANGDFLDIVDIIAQFETGLKGMGSEQKTAALGTIFGTKTVDGFNVLLAEGSEKLRAYREDIIDSENASITMSEAIRNSLGNRLKVLGSSLTEAGLKFVEAFETQGRGALDKLIIGIQNFDMNKVTDGIFKAIDMFKMMYNFVNKNIGIIKALGIALLSFKTAVVLVNAALVIQQGLMVAGPIVAMITVLGSLAATEGILATAQYALNMAMTANPIGVIVVAVAALVAGIILLIKKYKEFKEEFSGASFGDFVNPFSDERKQSRVDRRAERRGDEQGTSGANAVAMEKEKEKNAAMEDQALRYDLYLNAPANYSMSTTPGGAAKTAVNLGAQ